MFRMTLGLTLAGLLVVMTACQTDDKTVADVPGPAPLDSSITAAPDATLYPPPSTAGNIGTGPAVTGAAAGASATPTLTLGDPAPTAVSPGGSYIVQRGDTLWSIAKRTYNDGQRWRDIQQANPGLVPQRMRVGQVIRLP